MKNFLKQEKGINLISLTITVMIILIVTGMLLFNAKDSVRVEKLQNMYNDIANLREKVEDYYKQYGVIPGKFEFINVGDLKSSGATGANDIGKFYVIDLQALPSLTLNYGEDYYRAEEENVDINTLKDIYIINEISHNIFYVEGISVKANGQTKSYYTDESNIDKAEVKVKDIPNSPKLAEGMIPIKWESGNWIICSEDDPEWYEYVNQEDGIDKTSKWANVMLSDGRYKEGSEETEKARDSKTPIDEKELGSMFVWIPRYAYQIENTYHIGYMNSGGGKINIKFLKDTKEYHSGDRINADRLTNESGEKNWNEHPAFRYGDKILSGIWVAKFEASSTTATPDTDYGGGNTTDLNIKVLPGKQAWRNINISNAYKNCIDMNNTKNASIYGISTNNNRIDPHLMKNDEWGAVAYLAQSSYGRNGNQVNPNINGYGEGKKIYTGYAGASASATNPWNGEKPTNVYYYNTSRGMLASTTGNITGIFDMSGGTEECTAGYVNNGHNNLKNAQILMEADIKYKNIYKAIKEDGSEATAGDDNQKRNYEEMKSIYGDAVYETSTRETSATNNVSNDNSAWHGDNSDCPHVGNPFFVRGGNHTSGRNAGLFGFEFSNGRAASKMGFRPTLAVY